VADIVLLLVVFAGLAALSTTYEESARQFPQVFLYAGIVVLSIQLLISVLPARYSGPLQRYTSGLAEDMELDDEDDVETESHDRDDPSADSQASSDIAADAGELRDQLRRLGLVLGLVVGYFLTAYLVGFLLATPLFVFATVFSFGSRSYGLAVLLSVVFVITIYLLFGELMNVPIMEGILLP
jgi:hypothetical protein